MAQLGKKVTYTAPLNILNDVGREERVRHPHFVPSHTIVFILN